jgi:hypothetical protein
MECALAESLTSTGAAATSARAGNTGQSSHGDTLEWFRVAQHELSGSSYERRNPHQMRYNSSCWIKKSGRCAHDP